MPGVQLQNFGDNDIDMGNELLLKLPLKRDEVALYYNVWNTGVPDNISDSSHFNLDDDVLGV